MLAALALLATLIIAPDASAQSKEAADWRHGTTLSLFGGAGKATSETGAVVGTELGWEVNPHLVIEGRGIWFDTSQGSSAFTAILGARAPLLPAHRFVPYVSGGVGMFRATFDSDATEIPDFYRQRMDPNGSQVGKFDDFMLSFGVGGDLFLNEHFTLRPEVNLLVVFGDSDSRTVPVYGVTLAYHFEAHPIMQ